MSDDEMDVDMPASAIPADDTVDDAELDVPTDDIGGDDDDAGDEDY